MLFNGSRISPRMMEQTPNILLATKLPCSNLWNTLQSRLILLTALVSEEILLMVYWMVLTAVTHCSKPSFQSYFFLLLSLSSQSAQLHPTLCDPMGCSTPGFPVHHELLELAQTHVHRVGDATQLSHSLSLPSPPALNLSQHQGLFQWVSSSQQPAEIPAMTKTSLLCLYPWLITFTRLSSLVLAPESHMFQINFLQHLFFSFKLVNVRSTQPWIHPLAFHTQQTSHSM